MGNTAGAFGPPQITPLPAAHAAGPAPVKWEWPSVHREGMKFAGLAAVAALLAFAVGWSFPGWLLVVLTVAIAAFFRDPVRTSPGGDGLLLSPADGLISQITQVELPRQLIGEGALAPGSATRISVFMSVFDVHINRTPVAGTIKRVAYVPGRFVNADLDKASDENERQYLVVEAADGTRVGFTQIAGLVARRIVSFVREGAIVGTGQRIGLIRFGSRVDIFLPAGYRPCVLKGQRAVAGETILAVRDGGALVAGARQ
ncbi:MAG: phosphatidylserine decarboxylase [Sphingomonadaceae bacterium]